MPPFAPPVGPAAVAPARSISAPDRFAARAAVLGSAATAIPVGAALANTLRARDGFPAAVVATWSPGHAARAPRGPATPAAARVAARLTVRGLEATACGRLAWLALPDHVVAAAMGARRAAAVLDVPLVTVLAGARCDIVEALLAEQDLVLVVTREPESALARLAVGACSSPALACPPLPSTARRLLARAGLSRLAMPCSTAARSAS
jgi:hypothetical protein